MEYLSLKTKDREYTIEPQFFDMVYTATYDLRGRLIGEKGKGSASDALKWKKQIEEETGGRFVIVKA